MVASDFPILPIALIHYNEKLWFMENVEITHGYDGEYWIKLNDLEILRTEYDDVYENMLWFLDTEINKQRNSCFTYLNISRLLDLAYFEGLSLRLFYLVSQKEERIPLKQVEEVLKLYCGSYLKSPLSVCNSGVVKYEPSKGVFTAYVQNICNGKVISGEFETLKQALEFLRSHSVVKEYFWEDLKDFGMVVVDK